MENQPIVQALDFAHPRSILTLPLDVLFEICKLACADAAHFKTRNLKNFQLACKVFRSVALSTPRLWSCIDFRRMTPERMGLQLSRNGSVGMSFRIAYYTEATSCYCERWQIIKIHSSRWSFGAVKLVFGETEEGHDCLSALVNTNFPRLCSLSMDVHVEYGKAKKLNWKMPRLEFLTINSHHHSPLPLSTPLKHLTIENESHRKGELRELPLLRLLKQPAVTAVHSLTLDFSKESGFHRDDERPRKGVRILLCQLDTLTTDFGSRVNHYHDIDFLQHLDMPKLKQLRLRLHYSTFSFSNCLWMWMGGLPKLSPKLTTVDVTLWDTKFGAIERELVSRKIFGCFSDLSPPYVEELGSSRVVISCKHGIDFKITFLQRCRGLCSGDGYDCEAKCY